MSERVGYLLRLIECSDAGCMYCRAVLKEMGLP